MHLWRPGCRVGALLLGGCAAVCAQVGGPASAPRGADYKPGPVVEWTTAAGGDGHRYQAVETPSGATWAEAYQWAVAHGGFLAAIASAAENDFIFKLIDAPKFWVTNPPYNDANLGPWLGGCRLGLAPTPKDGWIWVVDRSPITFFNWSANQPDRRGAGEEDFLHFVSNNLSVRKPEWNDVGAERRLRGFVVEYFTPAEIAARAATTPGPVLLYPEVAKQEESPAQPPAPAPPAASTPPPPPAPPPPVVPIATEVRQ